MYATCAESFAIRDLIESADVWTFEYKPSNLDVAISSDGNAGKYTEQTIIRTIPVVTMGYYASVSLSRGMGRWLPDNTVKIRDASTGRCSITLYSMLYCGCSNGVQIEVFGPVSTFRLRVEMGLLKCTASVSLQMVLRTVIFCGNIIVGQQSCVDYRLF
jgi:hypothetical protein